MEEGYLTVNELCMLLKVSEPWVYKLVREKRIPFLRIAGKVVRFKLTDIESWIEAGRDQKYCRDKHQKSEIGG